MEINTQQMEALLHLQEQQAQLPRREPGAQTGFEALLNQQMSNDAATNPGEPAIGAMQPGLYTQLLVNDTEETEAPDPDSAVLKEAFDQASGTLDLWDSYTRTLGTSTNDKALRDAWGLLEGIDAQVAMMRDNPLRARSAALDSILNELEVMTATEKFKFNRGDYF